MPCTVSSHSVRVSIYTLIVGSSYSITGCMVRLGSSILSMIPHTMKYDCDESCTFHTNGQGHLLHSFWRLEQN